MKKDAFENEREGGFGGDPDENFFRGEIIYEDPEMILEKERAGRKSRDAGYSKSADREKRRLQNEAGEYAGYDGYAAYGEGAGDDGYAAYEEDGGDGGYADYEEDEEDAEESIGPETDDEYGEAADYEGDTEFYHDAKRSSAPGPKEHKRMKQKDVKAAPQQSRKKRKHKSPLWKLLRLFIILAAVVLIAVYLAVHLIYGKMNYSEVESVKTESYKEDGVINILLIGNDSRENGEDGRSDAMILLSVSNKTKTIQMTSLLRDMYVEIPGHDGNRLNAAYAYGGAELLMETVEQNLGISVNRYVLVNFEAFANLVDAVGGVDLELTNDEVQYVNGYLVEYNMLTGKPEGTDYLDASLSGMIHLNGPQALAYSRNRYIGTDFGRTERQRKVLSAVIKNLPKSVVTNPAGLVNGLLPNLTTNLTNGECYRLGLQAGKLLTYEIVQGSVPVDGSYQNATIRGMAVLQVDFEKNREYLRSSIYGE